MIYLDNAATTKVSPEVMEAMSPYFSEFYGNPGSIHFAGRVAEEAVENARKYVAAPIGADPNNIIFTGGGSEANNLAIRGVAEYLKSIGKNHIITTQVEHHSVLECLKQSFYDTFYVTYLPVRRDGSIDIELLEASICDRTGLVSVMTVNNETGNLYPIHEIGEICHQNNVLFHTDCVQGYCQTGIDVKRDFIDLLSASGHKIHAPKGVGFLYTSRKELLHPVIYGGSQEYGLRGGTHNTPYIVGMGWAAQIAHKSYLSGDCVYGEMLSHVKQQILSEIPDAHINGTPFANSKIVNIRFDGVDGETLLMVLDSMGIEVSAGSACSAHYAVPSHVLSAIGLTDDEARGSIRISVSKYTTFEEINEAIQAIVDTVKEIRGG